MSSRLVVIPRFFYGKKLNGKETKHLDGNLIGISLDNIMYIYVIYHRYNQLRLYIYIYIWALSAIGTPKRIGGSSCSLETSHQSSCRFCETCCTRTLRLSWPGSVDIAWNHLAGGCWCFQKLNHEKLLQDLIFTVWWLKKYIYCNWSGLAQPQTVTTKDTLEDPKVSERGAVKDRYHGSFVVAYS